MQNQGKHFEKRSSSCKELPPLVPEMQKNKKSMPHGNNSTNYSQQFSSTDKRKVYPPRKVSSSTTNLNSDARLQKTFKAVKGKKSDKNISEKVYTFDVRTAMNPIVKSGHSKTLILKVNKSINETGFNNILQNNQAIKSSQTTMSKFIKRPKSADERILKNTNLNKEELVCLSNIAKTVTELLGTVRENMAKIEQFENEQNTKDDLNTGKFSDGNPPNETKSFSKIRVSQSCFNLPKPKTGKSFKEYAVDLKQTIGKDSKDNDACKFTINSSHFDKDMEQRKEEQLGNKRNAVRDPDKGSIYKTFKKHKDSKMLLEIRPTYIENIQKNMNVKTQLTNVTESSNKSPNNAGNSEMLKKDFVNSSKDFKHNKSFILIDAEEPTVRKCRSKSNVHNETTCKEKGLTFVDLQATSGKSKNDCGARSQETVFILVKGDVKSENNFKRSKQESKNFVLVNDNPICNLKDVGKNSGNSQPGIWPSYQDGLQNISNPDLNLLVDNSIPDCSGLCTKRGKSSNCKLANQNQGQLIGGSNSTEELQHPSKNLANGEKLANKEGESSNLTNDSVKQEDGFEKLRKMVELKLEEMRLKAQNNKSVFRTNKEFNYCKQTAKGNGKILKENYQGSKSEFDVHNETFQTSMKTQMKDYLESVAGKKMTKEKVVKKVCSPIDLNKSEQPKAVTKQASPVKVKVNTTNQNYFQQDGSNKTTNINPGKSNTDFHRKTTKIATHNNIYHRYFIKEGNSQADINKELKLNGQRNNRSQSLPPAQPQLYLKPEEMSRKKKSFQAFEANTNSFQPKIITPPSSKNKPNEALIKWLKAKSSKTDIISTKKQNQLREVQIQKTAKDKKLTINGKKHYVQSDKPARTSNSQVVNKSVSLPNLFQQTGNKNEIKKTLPLNRSAMQARRKLADGQYFKVKKSQPRTNQSNPKQNKELIGELQNQWAQDFQNKHKASRFYNVQAQKNTNCLVEVQQDTSEATLGKNSNNPDSGDKPNQTSSPQLITYRYPRKLERIPSTGLAERLLAASMSAKKKPVGGKTSPEAVPSISSITSTTQATTEVDDFPEVDHFEEWIHTNTPDIYKDSNKEKSFLNYSTDLDPLSKLKKSDSMKLATESIPRYSPGYGGSSVDTQSKLNLTCQPKPIKFVDTITKDKLFDEISGKDETTRSSINKHSEHSSSISVQNITDSSNVQDSFTDSDNSQLKILSRQHNAKNIHHSADKTVSSARRADKRDLFPDFSKTNPVNIKTMFDPMNVKRAFRSFDGVVTMDVRSDSPPRSPKQKLKSNLKKSPGLQQAPEKRVSFISRPDQEGERKSETVAASRVEDDNSYVDKPQLEGQLARDKISREKDVRRELKDQRKRAEMEARMKMIHEYANKIREYEAILTKYKDIIDKAKVDAVKGHGNQANKASEV